MLNSHSHLSLLVKYSCKSCRNEHHISIPLKYSFESLVEALDDATICDACGYPAAFITGITLVNLDDDDEEYQLRLAQPKTQ